ncbi:MAG: YiiD C-terminal domain-containing protein [Deltaproteobacteria bacterium]|nr:YiiD C-terminal domain-containing protein [Deltaproteobacteria bacterium]
MIDEKYRDILGYLETAVKIIEKMGIKIVELHDRSTKLSLPLEPNLNHIGTMYAGSLFSLAEFSGGVMFAASFDIAKYFPIVKEMSIRYRRPAATAVTLEVELSPERVEEIRAMAEEKGKADYSMDLELKDETGEVCSIVHGTWQLRKVEGAPAI